MHMMTNVLYIAGASFLLREIGMRDNQVEEYIEKCSRSLLLSEQAVGSMNFRKLYVYLRYVSCGVDPKNALLSAGSAYVRNAWFSTSKRVKRVMPIRHDSLI